MRPIPVLLVAALTAAGCVTTAAPVADHVLTGTPGAPYTGEVRLVMDGAPLPDGYEEVAIVSATGRGFDASLQFVLGALQSEAASLGCDAVIRVRYDRGAENATATGVAVRLR